MHVDKMKRATKSNVNLRVKHWSLPLHRIRRRVGRVRSSHLITWPRPCAVADNLRTDDRKARKGHEVALIIELPGSCERRLPVKPCIRCAAQQLIKSGQCPGTSRTLAVDFL